MDLEQVRTEFVLSTYGAVLALLVRRVRDRHAAEDLAQDAYAAVLRAPGFDPRRRGAFSFVKRAALWRADERGRRMARAPKPLPTDLADPRAGSPGEALGQEEECDRARRLFAEAMDDLPARDREMARGFYVRGISVAELALSSGLAPQSVRGALSRAKKVILARLGLPRITNGQMKTLAAFAAPATPNSGAARTAPVRPHATLEEAPMSTASGNRDHRPGFPTPATPAFPQPDKVEGDTKTCRRHALRAAIEHLLGLGWNPARHDRMMCVLNNRDVGLISQDECDRLWAAFAREFGIGE